MQAARVRRWVMLAVLATLSLSQLACGHFGEATAKGAVIGSYEGYLELKKKHEGLSVTKILGDPEFREAAQDLTKAFVVGAGEGYDEAHFEKKADTLVRAMLVAAREESNEAVGQILEEQGPRLQLIVRQTLSTSIRSAGAEFRAAATTDGAAAVRAIMDAAIESLYAQIDPQRTKAVQQIVEALTRGAGAGLVAGLRDELEKPATQVALGKLTRSAATGAREGLLDNGGGASSAWTTAAILLGALFFLSALALIFYIRKSVLSGRALTVVAQQINKDADEFEPVAEMKRRISERARRAGVEAHLSAHLKDRGM